jgi:hypothetical protein
VATSKSAARKSTSRPAKSAGRPRASIPPARPAARPAAAADPAPVEVAAPPPGTSDLAGGLRSYLGAIDAEVRAVSSLSERIDALVAELNDLRDQQSKRLIVLDELRASVSDASLGAFLDQAIKPRKTRVREVVPERLM